MKKKILLPILFITFILLFSIFSRSISQSSKNNSSENQLEPEVVVDTNYYQIHGTTDSDLYEQMSEKGPTDEYGKHFAYCKWKVSWNYKNNKANGQCAVSKPYVKAEITYTYPQWDMPDNILPPLREKWTKYIQSVEEHEAGHKENGLKAANEIFDNMQSFSAYPDCRQLEEYVNNTNMQVIEKYSQEDLSYDQLTQSGVNQGAIFLPN